MTIANAGPTVSNALHRRRRGKHANARPQVEIELNLFTNFRLKFRDFALF